MVYDRSYSVIADDRGISRKSLMAFFCVGSANLVYTGVIVPPKGNVPGSLLFLDAWFVTWLPGVFDLVRCIRMLAICFSQQIRATRSPILAGVLTMHCRASI